MKNNLDQYLSTGEFAKLCGVSKHTLFHYDEVGVLRPEFTAENGYRYYSIRQFLSYDIIAVLKAAGMPLKEIKSYMEHQDPASFLAILRQKEKRLLAEQKKIKQMRRLLLNTLQLTSEGMQTVCGAARLVECEEEYLITLATPPVMSDEERIMRLREHFAYCESRGFDEDYPVGSILTKASIEAGLFDQEDYVYSRIPRKVASPRLQIKPAGLYAQIDHKGSYDTILDSFLTLLDFIKKEGRTIAGDAYEYELLGYLAAGDPEKYVTRISIYVR